MKRFEETSLVRPQVPTGLKAVSLGKLEFVKNLFEQDLKSHLRHVAKMLNLRYRTIWNILRTQISSPEYRVGLPQTQRNAGEIRPSV